MKRRIVILTLLVAAGASIVWYRFPLSDDSPWTREELALIQSLSLNALPELPSDPSNAVADNPRAAEFGHQLFFDTRLSANNNISCASCHQPDSSFTDGLPLAVGLGAGERNTPGLLGLSYSPWFYWDGRKDSQWAQALAPLEASHEHGFDRTAVANLIQSDNQYRTLYGKLFEATDLEGDLPPSASPSGNELQRNIWLEMSASDRGRVNRIFAGIGKALAAYQRVLMPGRSAFDEYVSSLGDPTDASIDQRAMITEEFTEDARNGLRLFIGAAQCVNCHNGPLLTNHDFHNTGVMALAGELPPMGRYDGIRIARDDPFNCLGAMSDATRGDCTELRFARDTNELVGAHKTPTLRNVSETAPYMHGGQIATLAEVMQHYNEAPTSMLSHNEAKPLGLRQAQLRQLEAFMRTLTAPPATATHWLSPPASN